MRPTAARRSLYVFWCWLYIGIGCVSLAAGLFVANIMYRLGKDSPPGLGFIAFVLFLFGPVRIGNSVWVLRKLNAQRRTR